MGLEMAVANIIDKLEDKFGGLLDDKRQTEREQNELLGALSALEKQKRADELTRMRANGGLPTDVPRVVYNYDPLAGSTIDKPNPPSPHKIASELNEQTTRIRKAKLDERTRTFNDGKEAKDKASEFDAEVQAAERAVFGLLQTNPDAPVAEQIERVNRLADAQIDLDSIQQLQAPHAAKARAAEIRLKEIDKELAELGATTFARELEYQADFMVRYWEGVRHRARLLKAYERYALDHLEDPGDEPKWVYGMLLKRLGIQQMMDYGDGGLFKTAGMIASEQADKKDRRHLLPFDPGNIQAIDDERLEELLGLG